MTPNDLIKKYNTCGFVIIKNKIPKKKIKEIQKTIIRRSKFYLKHKKYNKGFYDKHFHKALIHLKKNDQKSFGSFYDSIQKSLALFDIILDKKLINLIKKFSNLKICEMSFNGENLRMDIPNDKSHKLGWHQDRSYYFQNRDGNQGLVCWIPLIKINKKIGPLKLAISSHKSGFIKKYKKFKTQKFSSFQRLVTFKKNLKKRIALVNEGDVIFLNKNLIHASGTNNSDFIRFSLQIRVHDLMDENYLSFRSKIIYNSSDIEKMKKKGLDISDIESFSY